MAAPASDASVDLPRRINRAVAKISPWWIYGLGMIPAAWYFWLGATGSLSANRFRPSSICSGNGRCDS